MHKTTPRLLSIALCAIAFDASARFVSTDPVQADPNTGTSFNRYWYSNNNPYRYIDPDGREIRAVNQDHRARIETEINAQTTQEFKFDSNGKLQATGNPSGAEVGSQIYTNRIADGINAEGSIHIGVQTTYPGSDGAVNIDSEHGGGMTGVNGSGDVVVLISGNSLNTTDAAGGAIVDSPSDILRHEMVGHAVPQALGNTSGNAIANDNATRIELGKPMLPYDPSHRE